MQDLTFIIPTSSSSEWNTDICIDVKNYINISSNKRVFYENEKYCCGQFAAPLNALDKIICDFKAIYSNYSVERHKYDYKTKDTKNIIDHLKFNSKQWKINNITYKFIDDFVILASYAYIEFYGKVYRFKVQHAHLKEIIQKLESVKKLLVLQ